MRDKGKELDEQINHDSPYPDERPQYYLYATFHRLRNEDEHRMSYADLSDLSVRLDEHRASRYDCRYG